MSRANAASSPHQQTPRLEVRTGRGLAVRTVNYGRTLAGDPAEVQVARQCYSPSGQLLSQIDPRLFARAQAGAMVTPNFRYRHSLSGRALRIEGVDNGLRLDLSDVLGRPHWSGDGRGMQQRSQYDALGRPRAVFERDTAGVERCRERFDYGEAAEPAAGNNLRGQLWRHWDPAGERLVPGYSLQAQPLGEQRRFLLVLGEPDWPADEAAGEQLLEAEVAMTRWGYDALGEQLSQLDAAGHRRRSAFNRAGQLAGRWLTPAGQAETRVQGELDYNALGQLTTERAGNGVRTTRTYDPATQRLQRLKTQRQPDNRLLQDLHYDYDPVGNVLRIEDASQTVRYFRNQRIEAVSRYAYDSLYRLIEACGREAANAGQQGASLPPLQPLGDGSQVVNYRRTYRYDVADNLLSVQHQGAQSYRLDMTVSEHSNRALRSQAGLTAGDVEGGFDPNGNLRELQPGQALQWEAHNQLSRVRLLAREAALDDEERYGYDGARQRVRKRRTLHGGNQTQVQETRYLPGLELHRSWQTDRGGQGRRTTEAYQVVSDGTVRWLHWEAGLPDGLSNDRYRYSLDDHLGSSALETDDQGQLLSREEYYPFGGTALWAGRSEVEASYKTLRYSGKERDATGLYYYGYRYYAPWLQRWLNPDPAGTIDGLNLYRMVRNNPVNFYDFEGGVPLSVDSPRVQRKIKEMNYWGAITIAGQEDSNKIQDWIVENLRAVDGEKVKLEVRSQNSICKIIDCDSSRGLNVFQKYMPDVQFSRREELAYKVSREIGFNLVPPVNARQGKFMKQLFVMGLESRPGEDISIKAKIFNYIINEPDTNSGNQLWDTEGNIVLVDHESAFGSSGGLPKVDAETAFLGFDARTWMNFTSVSKEKWQQLGEYGLLGDDEKKALRRRAKDVKGWVQKSIDNGQALFGVKTPSARKRIQQFFGKNK